MARYSSEPKVALLKKLLPPINMSVAELARQENISEVTLYNWRKQAKAGGFPVTGDNKLTDEWPAAAKFATVLETAALSEIELSEYCRRKGLYPEQVQQWRQACILGQQSARTLQQAVKVQSKADKKSIRQLEQELRRKDKALAEAAALLILQEKLDAYWSSVDEADLPRCQSGSNTLHGGAKRLKLAPGCGSPYALRQPML